MHEGGERSGDGCSQMPTGTRVAYVVRYSRCLSNSNTFFFSTPPPYPFLESLLNPGALWATMWTNEATPWLHSLLTLVKEPYEYVTTAASATVDVNI